MARSADQLRDVLRVRGGVPVDLSKIDPAATYGRVKETAAAELEDGLARLTDLQDRLWAEGKRRVLVVLQASMRPRIPARRVYVEPTRPDARAAGPGRPV